MNITISLSEEEALVLFEWLASLETRATATSLDDAEQTVASCVECQLEKQLTAVLRHDYSQLLAVAKQKILDG